MLNKNPSSTSPESLFPLLVFFALSFSAAAIGAAFPPGEWYAALDKPSWNPPSWLFGPVWSLLYTCIAVAGWRIYRRLENPASPAMAAWGIQLILNALWSWLFFGLHRPDLALVEILILLGTILATIALFFPKDQIAAYLMIPYALWVSFASFLTFTLWQLNF